MFFYNVVSGHPICGFNADNFAFDIQTPKVDSFRITITCNNTVHIISDLYAGDKTKQDAALAKCITYCLTQFTAKKESCNISDMITSLEFATQIKLYVSPDNETQRSKHLKSLAANKKKKKEENEIN
tara:strand:+ start:7020 stop:7400 length:381 start_codon:yes stop_codon:yes gene_type:complete